MNASSVYRVGDRVVAETSSFGTVRGTVVNVVLGQYLHIRSDADDNVYGVHESACRRTGSSRPAYGRK
jgi:hypothetical protein